MVTHVAIIKIVKPVRVVSKVALLKVVLGTIGINMTVVVGVGGVVLEVVANVRVDFQCITMMATLYEESHYKVALSTLKNHLFESRVAFQFWELSSSNMVRLPK